jgi:hypothetical protein
MNFADHFKQSVHRAAAAEAPKAPTPKKPAHDDVVATISRSRLAILVRCLYDRRRDVDFAAAYLSDITGMKFGAARTLVKAHHDDQQPRKRVFGDALNALPEIEPVVDIIGVVSIDIPVDIYTGKPLQ